MTSASAPITERRYILPFILVTSLFFLWSIGVNLNDVLIPHLRRHSTSRTSNPLLFKWLFSAATVWLPFLPDGSWKKLATEKAF